MADSTAKPKLSFDLDIELALMEKTAKRQICVGANITFERLHKIIQAAYCWQECHMYQFLLFKEGKEGEQPSVEIVTDKETAMNPKAAKLVHRAKLVDYMSEYKHILYIYDFGDDWMHYIDVVGSSDDCSDSLPLFLGGENDAPPEGCGGPPGFADFEEIMKKPRHKEHKEMKSWAKEQGWELFGFDETKLRVWLAGNPGKHVWVKRG